MRILLASDSFDPAVGGVQRVAKDLASTLVERGHDVRVLAPWAPGCAEREDVDGLAVRRVRLGRPALRPRALLGFLRRRGAARTAVAAMVAELRADVAHLHFLQSPLAYLLPDACRQRGVPLVATAHGRDVVGSMVEDDPLGRRAVRRVLGASSSVTAPSAATLRDARRLAGRGVTAHFVVVPNGLPADMEAQLALPPSTNGRGIVAVGELHEKKGFDVLLRALADVPGETLRIAGEGAERGALEELARTLGVADRVTFVGFVPRARLPDLLRSAVVQAVPSRREPFGLVILEAMACGVPVVASSVDGIPGVAGESGAARLVAPDDPAALAAALRSLLADAGERERLIALGHARARDLTVARMTDAYEEVYRACATGRSA